MEGGQILRESRNIEGQEWLATHGIHVRHAIGRSNRTVRVGIVHDGGEEVGRYDQGARSSSRRQTAASSGPRESDQQIRVCRTD